MIQKLKKKQLKTEIVKKVEKMTLPHSYRRMAGILILSSFHHVLMIRVRVRERLSTTPGHVIGRGSAPGGRIVPRGGGGGDGDLAPGRRQTSKK